MRGIHIFEKPYYREIRAMRGRVIRGLPSRAFWKILNKTLVVYYFQCNLFLNHIWQCFIAKLHRPLDKIYKYKFSSENVSSTS